MFDVVGSRCPFGEVCFLGTDDGGAAVRTEVRLFYWSAPLFDGPLAKGKPEQ